MKKVVPKKQPTTDLPLEELAAPAQRALANAGIQNLKQLAMLSEGDVKQLHGIGPHALKKLKLALAAKGFSFAKK